MYCISGGVCNTLLLSPNKKTGNYKKKQSRNIRLKLKYDLAVCDGQIFDEEYINKIKFRDKCSLITHFLIYIILLCIYNK